MRIDHIALFCRDLVAMRQFFLDYFEAVSNEQYHNPRTGLRTYILSFTEGSTRLELMQRPDVADADPSVAAIGYIHISIAVGSKRGVDLLTRRLADDGYPRFKWPSNHWRWLLRELYPWSRENPDRSDGVASMSQTI